MAYEMGMETGKKIPVFLCASFNLDKIYGNIRKWKVGDLMSPDPSVDQEQLNKIDGDIRDKVFI